MIEQKLTCFDCGMEIDHSVDFFATNRAHGAGDGNWRCYEHYRLFSNKRNTEIRKEKLKRNGGKHTARQWRLLVSFYCPEGKCLACGNGNKLTKDHVVPLCCGGTNSIDNLQPLCIFCNMDKAGRVLDYRPDKGIYARLLAQQTTEMHNERNP